MRAVWDKMAIEVCWVGDKWYASQRCAFRGTVHPKVARCKSFVPRENWQKPTDAQVERIVEAERDWRLEFDRYVDDRAEFIGFDGKRVSTLDYLYNYVVDIGATTFYLSKGSAPVIIVENDEKRLGALAVCT